MNPSGKILSVHDLAVLLSRRRAASPFTVVHCHGVFDLLHVGHIRHFRQARELGDVLVVTVTPDHFVNKGPGRPVFTETLRLEAIAALECVDYVAVNEWATAIELIALLRPNIYVKGMEFQELKDITGAVAKEKSAVESIGGRMDFTGDIVFSSSSLLNQHMDGITPEIREFLDGPGRTCTESVVTALLDGCRNLRVLVVGETIMDEYQYCDVLGKSGKEPILAAQYLSTERNAGGVLAVANHVAGFCNQVRLVTMLGEIDSCEEEIRARLAPQVTARFLTQTGAPTIVKRRFVQQYPFQKLFEVYVMDDQPPPECLADFNAVLLEELAEADIVIVTDYGHGLLDSTSVKLLSDKANFLAINTQKNAGNHGFNTISKYSHADFVAVSESELRLDQRDRKGSIIGIIEDTVEHLCCQSVIVTQGGAGCLCFRRGEGVVHIPALTGHFRDRVGAGDAMFAVTAMCAYQNAPAALTGFIGNAVGTQAVGTVSNRKAVDRVRVERHLHHLLK